MDFLDRFFQSTFFSRIKNYYYLIAFATLVGSAALIIFAKIYFLNQIFDWIGQGESVVVSRRMLAALVLVAAIVTGVLALYAAKYYRLLHNLKNYGIINPNSRVDNRGVELHWLDDTTYLRKLTVTITSRIRKLDGFTDRFTWSGSRDSFKLQKLTGFSSGTIKPIQTKYCFVDLELNPPLKKRETRTCCYELILPDTGGTFNPYITFRKYDSNLNSAKVFLPREYVGQEVLYERFFHTTSGISLGESKMKFAVSDDGQRAIFDTGVIRLKPFIIHKFSWKKLDLKLGA